MALLNLNKKAGDTFTAEEVNKIGKAIDDNTKIVATLQKTIGEIDKGLTELVE